MEPLYSRTIVIRRLMVSTFNTGIIPASNVPPCNKVNRIVVTVAAITIL